MLGAANDVRRGHRNLIASEAVVAASIRDELWAEFYQGRQFQALVRQPALGLEIIAVLQGLQARNAQAQSTLGFTQMAIKRQVPLNAEAIRSATDDQRRF